MALKSKRFKPTPDRRIVIATDRQGIRHVAMLNLTRVGTVIVDGRFATACAPVLSMMPRETFLTMDVEEPPPHWHAGTLYVAYETRALSTAAPTCFHCVLLQDAHEAWK